MPAVRIISSSEVRELLDPVELRAALQAALIAQSQGLANVPPRIAAVAAKGLLAAMPGYLADSGDGLLATKLVAIFPDNVDAPSHQGLIAYFDAATGSPLALMDAEIITEDRTAGTAAIAADLLARSDSRVLTIVGAGAQGKAHGRAFAPLRAWDEIRIVSRTYERAEVMAAAFHADGLNTIGDGCTIVACANIDDAVRGADVVAMCTHANHRVIDPRLVGDGVHVSSVGSLAELPSELVGVGPLVVDHLGAVTTAPPAGALEIQDVDPTSVVELGALIAGESEGRMSDKDITVYKSTGHAVQDIAAAKLVYDKALAAGVGIVVNL
jgi:ornithine cyclodeaminase/alanine dehydrogenase-like protein (mu-crystallin family)